MTTTSDAPAAVDGAGDGRVEVRRDGVLPRAAALLVGPADDAGPNAGATGNAGTQLRTPPLVPDANYIDWRYTNSLVAPWTELNFHYGNDRVKATVQIASYNLTDSGYRRLESNLGINEAFLTMTWPEFISENGRLTLIAGAFTNRYGAAGRYDAGKYETYLFGRTHIAGETLTFDYDWNDWTFEVEEGFGGKLEPIPFYGPPAGAWADDDGERAAAGVGALPRAGAAGVDVRGARARRRGVQERGHRRGAPHRRVRERQRARGLVPGVERGVGRGAGRQHDVAAAAAAGSEAGIWIAGPT